MNTYRPEEQGINQTASQYNQGGTYGYNNTQYNQGGTYGYNNTQYNQGGTNGYNPQYGANGYNQQYGANGQFDYTPNGYGMGDLLINITVYVPEHLNDEEKATLEKLKDSPNVCPSEDVKKRIFSRLRGMFDND